MKKLIIPFILLIIISSCGKEYDFNDILNLSVKEFLTSKNCDVSCDETPDCEDKFVRLTGRVDDLNYFPNEHRFFLYDISKPDYFVEVQCDTIVSQAIFTKIDDAQVDTWTIGGLITSFDKPTNLNCTKGYILNVSDPDDLWIHYLPD